MEYRFLGNTGLKISALSLGAWVTFGDQMDIEASYEVMKTAFDNGVIFFDNAEAYAAGEAEVLMGKVIKKAGWKRSDLVLSTKIYWGGDGPNDTGLSRKHIIEGTIASLKRLQTDYVDLIFCHRPDNCTPIEETVRAMNYVINAGMAFYWGTSEWSSEQIREACEIARREHLIAPSMEQPQYNMLHRDKMEREYLRLFADFKMGTTIFSPLASGILTGKYNDEIPVDSRLSMSKYAWLFKQFSKSGAFEKARKLERFANDIGIPMGKLALAWCLKNPNVSSVITGATSPDQVKENVSSLKVIERLTPDVMNALEKVLQNKPDEIDDWRVK